MPKITRSKRTKKSGTRKNTTNGLSTGIVITFLQMLNLVKLYHWKTHSYATHKATDELYANLNLHMDKFVEVLIGNTQNRVGIIRGNKFSLKDVESQAEFKRELNGFKEYLVKMDKRPELKHLMSSDLQSIRDDILADVNQILYLLTFS
jgi:hypothetical protein